MPSGRLLTFACVACGAIHSVGSDSMGFDVKDVDNPVCNDIGLDFAFRSLHGPRPGGRGFQEQWEKKRDQFYKEHGHEQA